MQPSRRLRRGLAAAFAAAALPALTACSSGFGSPVLQDYNPSTGVNERSGDVWGMNLLVVLPESGTGTLVGTLFNTTARDDRLVGATVQPERGEQAEQPVRASLTTSGLTLPPDRLVELSERTAVQVEGQVTPGRFVLLTLRFQRAAPIQVPVPVVAPEGAYADVPLPGGPSPTPTEVGRSPGPPEPPIENPVEEPDEGPEPHPGDG